MPLAVMYNYSDWSSLSFHKCRIGGRRILKTKLLNYQSIVHQDLNSGERLEVLILISNAIGYFWIKCHIPPDNNQMIQNKEPVGPLNITQPPHIRAFGLKIRLSSTLRCNFILSISQIIISSIIHQLFSYNFSSTIYWKERTL